MTAPTFDLPTAEHWTEGAAADAASQARALRDRETRPRGATGTEKPKRSQKKKPPRELTQGPRSRPGNAGGAQGGEKPYQSRADLLAENAELTARLSALEAERGSPDALDEIAGQLVAPLTMTARVLGQLVASVLKAPWWQLSDDDAGTLAGAWAPVLAPKASQYAANLPLAAAVLVTVHVCAPRLELTLRARRGELPAAPAAPSPEGDADAVA